MTRLHLLLIAIVAFGGAYGAARLYQTTRPVASAAVVLDGLPELAWLRQELGLSDAQFEQVATLHRAYRPRCEALCAKITTAQERVHAAAAGKATLTPELTAALEEQARVQSACQQAMLAHLYETAALMEPAQATAFLQATLPHALNPAAYPSLHHAPAAWTSPTKN